MSNVIEILREYLPTRHGEQGVDATIHGAVKESTEIHEVFCNPPGGSWTEFDIIHPSDRATYRWDHIPRRPPRVKRPDQVFQHLSEDGVALLTIESKYDANDLTADIGSRLTGYFEGHENYTGLRERPCWHRKRPEGKWKVLPPTTSDSERYWFRDHPDVDYWTGFMFANSPTDLMDEERIRESLDDTIANSDVDVALNVSWMGEHQIPVLFGMPNEAFSKTEFWSALQGALEAHNSDTTTP
jgi:hypothetical protein